MWIQVAMGTEITDLQIGVFVAMLSGSGICGLLCLDMVRKKPNAKANPAGAYLGGWKRVV